MKILLGVLGAIAGLVIALGAIVWFNFYDIHVRYRLTLEVQDGDQIKTGSSVIEALYSVQPAWSPSGPNNYTPVIGYEPTVDLGDKGLLFLTFFSAARTPAQIREGNSYVGCRQDDVYCLPFEAYNKRGTYVRTAYSERSGPLHELLRQSGSRDVPLAVLPRLVRFSNINDPHTRSLVSPNDLATSFGPGVSLKRVILELTSDPITPMPEVWPQWLRQKIQHGGRIQ